ARHGPDAVDLRRHRHRQRAARAAVLAPPDAAAGRRRRHLGFGSRFASGRLAGRIKVVTDMTAQAGLRERKKARTRASLREHALRLFREQGYQATTVEQIAEAAEVSPATFYRYFPTKEDVVLQDDFDVLAMDALKAQPAGLGPIAAVRAAMAEMLASLTPEDLDRFRESTELTLAIPEVRARAGDGFSRTIQVMAE